MLRHRQEIEIKIEKIAFGGQGIAYHNNFVVFVEDAISDDYESSNPKGENNCAQAYPLQILKPSHLRIEAHSAN